MNGPMTTSRLDTVEEGRPAGRILRIKAGYNPNSSSLGTIIFAVPAAMLLAPALYNAIAAALTSATVRDRPRPHGRDSQTGSRPQPTKEDGSTQ